MYSWRQMMWQPRDDVAATLLLEVKSAAVAHPFTCTHRLGCCSALCCSTSVLCAPCAFVPQHGLQLVVVVVVGCVAGAEAGGPLGYLHT